MVSKWALAASLALAIASSGVAKAEDESEFTTWDSRPAPIEGRPGQYRTTTLDTWIRLTPWIGQVYWVGDELRLESGHDGDNDYTGVWAGFALEFEPADVLIASIDLGFKIRGTDALLTEEDNGTDGDQFVQGDAFHPAIYIGLKNPELAAGGFQAIIGLGLGAFMFSGYEETNVPLLGGGFADVEFEDTMLWHGTIFLRFDFEITPNFKLGVNIKNHLLLYAQTQDDDEGSQLLLGEMEHNEFALDNIQFAIEPSFYVSIAF